MIRYRKYIVKKVTASGGYRYQAAAKRFFNVCAEDFNNAIQLTKTGARGLRNFDLYRTPILLH